MKNWIKRLVVFISIISIVCFGSTVSAHEIYYKANGQGINLKWANLKSGKPHLKINGDYLESDYSGYYSNVVQAWPNASNEVLASSVSFSSSTVDMLTATEDYWDERFGLYSSLYYGIADIKDSTGQFIDTLTKAQYSSGSIVYAQVILTPYNNFNNNSHRQKTMIHELGHVLCLGHPDGDNSPIGSSVKSVMRQGNLGYKAPQQHDINDLSNKY